MMESPFPERNKRIVELRDYGWSFVEIGEKYSITRCRARQLYLINKKQYSIHREEERLVLAKQSSRRYETFLRRKMSREQGFT